MYGDGSQKTIVTGSSSVKLGGVGTFMTATFAAEGDGFMAMGMGFRNTAGPLGEQAVALRVVSDRAIFLNCRMEAYQDTLFAQVHRQFYRGCMILGTIDFIFGDSASVFQNCVLIVRRGREGQQNIVTAHGRSDDKQSTGFVIQKSRIVADPDLVPVQDKSPSYLARPWKSFSRTVFMETEIGEHISPDGYFPWGNTAINQATCYYAEYGNNGKGAASSNRVPWNGVKPAISKEEALQYTTSAFIQIANWIKLPGIDVPVRLGLYG